MNPIFFPTLQAPLSASEGVASLGFVYVGTAGTDPTVLGNRVSVTIREEDGSETVIPAASQPLTLSAGGSFIYNGAPVQVLVAGTYSMTIQNSSAAQVYYFPKVEPINGNNVELVAQGSDPTPTANGIVYTKVVSALVELFYMDDAGNITQITSGGALNLPETFPFPVQGSAPSAVADNMITYSKEVNGNLELFVIDPNGNEIQITNNGGVAAGAGTTVSVGGSTTTVTADNNGAILVFNSSTTVTVTVPEQATTVLPAGFYFLVKNEGLGEIKIATEGTDTIDGISLLQRPDLATTVFLQTAGTPNTWGFIGNDWLPTSVISAALTAPPGTTPNVGNVYVVAATATGSWVGEENNFAIHVGSDVYEFQSAENSIVCFDNNASSWIGFDGAAWVGFSFGNDYPALISPGATTYTAVAASAGNLIVFDSASDCTITMPETATETLAAGFECAVINVGTGNLFIAFEGSDTHTGVRMVQNTKEPTNIKKMTAGSPNDWLIFNNSWIIGKLAEWTGTAPVTGTPADGTIAYIDGTGSGAWAGGTRVFAIHVGSGVWDFQDPVIQYQIFYNPVNTKIETINTANGVVTVAI